MKNPETKFIQKSSDQVLPGYTQTDLTNYLTILLILMDSFLLLYTG